VFLNPFIKQLKVVTMTNLASLRANLTESGFELLSPSATLQIRGGGGHKNSGKKKNSGKGKKSNKNNGYGYGYCPPPPPPCHGH
jgi:hypothetical protein